MDKTVTANYDNQQIVSFTTGKKKFQTNGKAMKTDLSVSVDGSGTETVVVSYKGEEITTFGSGTKVLSCANKLMGSDVEAEVVGGTVTWTMTDIGAFGPGGSTALAAAEVGNYAIFASGTTTAGREIDVLDTVLTHTRAAALSTARQQASGASTENHAIIGGGVLSSNVMTNVADAYDAELTRLTIQTLFQSANNIGTMSFNGCAMFGGGRTSNGSFNGSSSVTVFDSALTKKSSSLYYGLYSVGGANNQNYAFFSGGYNSSGANNHTDAYNTSLTRYNAPNLSRKVSGLTGASTKNYAIFAMGNSDVVEAYDTSMTRSLLQSLSVSRNYGGGKSINDFAVFAGGSSATMGVDIFDTELVRTTPVNLSRAFTTKVAAARVGKYVVFNEYYTNAISYQ